MLLSTTRPQRPIASTPMPPVTRIPALRDVAEKLLAAAIVVCVLLWMASFVAVMVDPTGQAWKWLALAALVFLLGTAIATLFTIGRRRT